MVRVTCILISCSKYLKTLKTRYTNRFQSISKIMSVCVCVCLCLCEGLNMFVCVSVFVCLYLSVCESVGVFTCVSVCVILPLCLVRFQDLETVDGVFKYFLLLVTSTISSNRRIVSMCVIFILCILVTGRSKKYEVLTF